MCLRLLTGLTIAAAAIATPASSSSYVVARNGMLAFTSTLNSTEVYLENGDGSGARPLTSAPAGSRFPALSPDGSKLAFARRVNGQCQVFVMNVDGSGLTQISQGFGFNGQPDWSPDGTKLAFTGIGNGPPTIYIYDFTTGATTRLQTQTLDEDPRWSPDGMKLVYAGA